MTSPLPVKGGGRGARERIIVAATELFSRDGIHATTIPKLTRAAHVSSRTLYQHFRDKQDLVGAYLERLETDPAGPAGIERVLDRTDITPAQRIEALFSEPTSGDAHHEIMRGCPFHNVVVEGAGSLPGAAAIVRRHKERFTLRLIETAAAAGAHDPVTVGRLLAIVFEGSRALSTSLDDASPIADSRALAQTLLDGAALPRDVAAR